MSSKVDTHNLIVDFGRHRGTRWTRVPVSYLKWLINQPDLQGEKREIAQAELDRRGTVTPMLEISGHAIDRASLKCHKIWRKDRNGDEGLHAWLVRVAIEALQSRENPEQCPVVHKGMKLVFELDGTWPVLITIMRLENKSAAKKVSRTTVTLPEEAS